MDQDLPDIGSISLKETCGFCGALITYTNLARHKKKTKKCIKIQLKLEITALEEKLVLKKMQLELLEPVSQDV